MCAFLERFLAETWNAWYDYDTESVRGGIQSGWQILISIHPASRGVAARTAGSLGS